MLWFNYFFPLILKYKGHWEEKIREERINGAERTSPTNYLYF